MKNKLIVILVALALLSAMAVIPVQAAKPEGVTKVYKVGTDGATRNDAWKDAKTGIITLPLGEEFDNGGENHGVYALYDQVKAGDTYYVYWVLKVEENDELDEGDIIVSNDPWYLSSHDPDEASGDLPGTTLMEDYESLEFAYGDSNPGKWTIFENGFEVIEDDTQWVQHRLHYKNRASVQVKYMIVTSKAMQFVVNEETGEIDGVTNDNEFVVATPTPTEEPTPTPEETETPATTAPATTAPTATTQPTGTNAGNTQGSEGGSSTGLIIGIVVAVVVIAAVVVFFVVKKKKK